MINLGVLTTERVEKITKRGSLDGTGNRKTTKRAWVLKLPTKSPPMLKSPIPVDIKSLPQPPKLGTQWAKKRNSDSTQEEIPPKIKRHNVKLKEIKNVNSPEFFKVLQIYSTSFPENKTRPISDTIQMIGDRYRLFAMFENGKCLGFMLVYVFDGFALLDYMAVRSDMRGKGIGSMMLDEIKKILYAQSCKTIFLATQHGYKSGYAASRIRFYERNGAILVTGRYIMPGYGYPANETMNLMILSKNGYQRYEFTEDQLAEIVRQIYKHVYDCPRDDLIDIICHDYRLDMIKSMSWQRKDPI